MMSKIPTKQTVRLIEALKSKGVDIEPEHDDGHKHIDIFIRDVNIYIEVDGLPHYTNPYQIMRDFGRNYYSDLEGFNTIHIPNELIDAHLDDIAYAIAMVVEKRAMEMGAVEIVEKLKIPIGAREVAEELQRRHDDP